MSDGTQFRTTRNGYEPEDVEAAIAKLTEAVSTAKRAAEAAQTESETLRGELAGQRALVSALEDRGSGDSYTQLPEIGERIAKVLSTIDAESKGILAAAKNEARKVTEESTSASELLRRQAEEYAKDVKAKVDNEAVRLITEAQSRATEILDHADRESTARRDEAEAVFEQQRARAASMAAEFEQTLAERREKASREFTTQMAAQEAAIQEAEERRSTIESEAERYKTEVQRQVESTLTTANNQAFEIIEQARLTADKIRRESERELAAAGARRDAITSQLTNIRQMLATVSGAALGADLAQDGPSVTGIVNALDEIQEDVETNLSDEEAALQNLIDQAKELAEESDDE